MLINFFRSESSILLDCGEGTSGQIARFYGSKADEIFKRIKLISITHLHADHHLGIHKDPIKFLGLLLERIFLYRFNRCSQ